MKRELTHSRDGLLETTWQYDENGNILQKSRPSTDQSTTALLRLKDEELDLRLRAAIKTFLEIGFQLPTGRLETHTEVMKIKRDIVRIKTVQLERQSTTVVQN